MANPVLVEITRGPLIESVHTGSVAISEASGEIVASLGDIEALVYPRSSLKPIQALPLVESGAADAYGLGEEEIALACASHSGEPIHTERVASWLARIGCRETDLACGPQAVRYEPAHEEMIKRGESLTALHNNCSGKHAGFLTVARHWKIATAGYERHDHPVQQAVLWALRQLSGVQNVPWGVDGCVAPSFALPLSQFARAIAKFADPDQLDPTRASAAKRIVAAMIAHPELVSGTGRVCAILMRAAQGQAAVKTGAEGVYSAIIPSRKLGIALKIDDGAGRAAESAMASILDKLGLLGEDVAAQAIVRAPVANSRDAIVGERRAAPALADLTL